MASIYRIPNRQAAEIQAIRKLIRTSNAENITRRHAQDAAAVLRENDQGTVMARVLFLTSSGA
ncbi:hypothetical protein C7401_12641 [Paraburkholderia unamae]|uniref:hypothetical protein n=1 Tax=Paraburkholderia unamae TaxID=219649 RepID=UPI000DC4993C|nr:hypothetical protein [Paraburkholderia unamae]RAR53867.1 hypothetical protein C7401_12641 [Paraburkholderia unamae]